MAVKRTKVIITTYISINSCYWKHRERGREERGRGGGRGEMRGEREGRGERGTEGYIRRCSVVQHRTLLSQFQDSRTRDERARLH